MSCEPAARGLLAGFYERRILPRLVHLTCGSRPVMRQRAELVPAAAGRVLDVGFGSGLNLDFYDPRRVDGIWALEPSAAGWKLARRRVARSPITVEPLLAAAEEIPLDDATVDTVVLTFTLCTISEVAAALAEIRRVLRPAGRVLFCEHGASPDPTVRRWQERLTPLWKRLSGGCHLDRAVPALLERGGLEIREMSSLYLPGWKPAAFVYRGTAVPAEPGKLSGR